MAKTIFYYVFLVLGFVFFFYSAVADGDSKISYNRKSKGLKIVAFVLFLLGMAMLVISQTVFLRWYDSWGVWQIVKTVFYFGLSLFGLLFLAIAGFTAGRVEDEDCCETEDKIATFFIILGLIFVIAPQIFFKP